MIESVRTRLADARAALDALDQLLAGRGDALPGMLVARLAVDADKAAARLARHLELLRKIEVLHDRAC